MQQIRNRQQAERGNIDEQQEQQEQHIIDANNDLERNPESLYDTFFLPKNTTKCEIQIEEGSFSKKASIDQQDAGRFINNERAKGLLHVFVDWNQLFIHLNRKTPDGLSKRYFQGHKRNSLLYKVKLNESLSSKGDPGVGIDPFTLHCNANKNNFSAVAVSYQKEVHIVRVFAIVTLHKKCILDPQVDVDVRTVLVVGRLRKIDDSRRLDSIHCPILQYDLQQRSNKLEVDVIDLTSIIWPCCLIPLFTKHFRPKYTETRADLTATTRATYIAKARFFQVPIPTMHHFKVVNYKVIDDAIDRVYPPKQSLEETTSQKRQREDMEKNYIAYHLFLSEDELMWTENSNKVYLFDKTQASSLDSAFWEAMERGVHDIEDKDEDDDDDDDFVLLS